MSASSCRPTTRWRPSPRSAAPRLDVLLDFGAWPRFDAALAALSGAFIVGFDAGGQGRHFPYDVAVRHANDVHEIENFRRIAGAIGVEFHERAAPEMSPVALRRTATWFSIRGPAATGAR